MSHFQITRRLKCSIIMASWSGTNGSVTVNSPVPFDTLTDLQGTAASTVNITNNQITLPSGYWWFIKGSPQSLLEYNNSSVRYAWRDVSTNTQYGRSGFMTIQIASLTQGGDELACALIDCRSASVTVTLNVEAKFYATTFNTTTANYHAGATRALLWRLG